MTTRGTETRSAKTEGLGPKDDGPVPSGTRPSPCFTTPNPILEGVELREAYARVRDAREVMALAVNFAEDFGNTWCEGSVSAKTVLIAKLVAFEAALSTVQDGERSKASPHA